MGIVLILLGLAVAGVVADFLVENDLTSAPNQTVALFGGSFQLSTPEVGAAVFGALSILLVILGGGLFRGSWGRRRALKRLIADLEQENAALRSRVELATAADTRSSEESPAVAGEPR